MQEFLKLQLILADNHTPYEEFEQQLITSEIYQEIYLNLFLTVIVGNTGKSHEFGRYLLLLTTYGQRTKKKSAQVNYVGYKDKISILMHACQKNTVSVVTTLIEAGANNIEAIDQ